MDKINQYLLDNHEYFIERCSSLVSSYKQAKDKHDPVFHDDIKQEYERIIRIKIADDISLWTGCPYYDIMETMESFGALHYLGVD